MSDRYANFLELRDNQRENLDYRISAFSRPAALIVLAIHAGGIEPGTSELARAVAGDDFPLYLFEGLGSDNQVLHLTSTHFDEPGCLEMLKQQPGALSLHGFAESKADPPVDLGGADLLLRQYLLDALIENGCPARVNTGKFAASDPRNICNRTSTGKGAQMEISAGLRRQFFADYSNRKGREKTTRQFEHFVQVIRNALLSYQQR